jgi:hypothetical protein
MIKAIILANFRNTFSTRKISISILSFIVLMTLFNTVFFNSYKNTNNFSVNIIDEDISSYSNEFLDLLSNNNLIELNIVEKLDKTSLNDEKLQGIFKIEKGFGDKIQKGDLDKLISVYYLKNNIVAPVLSDIIAKDLLAVISAEKTKKSLDFYYKELNISKENKSYSRVLNYYKDDEFQLNFEYDMKDSIIKSIDYGIIQKRASLGITSLFSTIFIIILISFIESKNHSAIQKKISIHDKKGLKGYLANMIFLTLISLPLLLIPLYLVLFKYGSLGKFFIFFLITLLFIIAILLLLDILKKIFKNNIKLQTYAPLILLTLSLLGEGIFTSDFLPESMKLFAMISPYNFYGQFLYDNFIVGYSLGNGFYLSALIIIGIVLLVTSALFSKNSRLIFKQVLND